MKSNSEIQTHSTKNSLQSINSSIDKRDISFIDFVNQSVKYLINLYTECYSTNCKITSFHHQQTSPNFFTCVLGTTTDLVPQLLGMFDELARRGNGYTDHVVLPSACNIPAALQKRLSLVSHRSSSIFGQFHPELSKSQSDDAMAEQPAPENSVDVIVSDDVMPEKKNEAFQILKNNRQEDRNECTVEEKKPYRRESNSLTPLRYNRRCRNSGRPLSGSSVASSTSSSGCSNQGNTCAINPYLASVESLADTCASSQGDEGFSSKMV